MNVRESSSLSIFDSTERNLTEVGGNRKKRPCKLIRTFILMDNSCMKFQIKKRNGNNGIFLSADIVFTVTSSKVDTREKVWSRSGCYGVKHKGPTAH